MGTTGRMKRLLIGTVAAAAMLAPSVAGASLPGANPYGSGTSHGAVGSHVPGPATLRCAYQMLPVGSNHLLIADPCDGIVVKVRTDGTRSKAIGSFECPVGVAQNSKGALFVSDGCTGGLYKIAGGVQTTLVASGLATLAAEDIVVAGNRVYIAEESAGKVVSLKLDGSDQTELAAGSFSAPRSMALTPNGKLIVVDSDRNQLTKLSLDGSIIGTQDLPAVPNGVAVAPDGSIFVALDGRTRIKRLANNGSSRSFGPTFSGPFHLAVGANGNIFVVDQEAVAKKGGVFEVSSDGSGMTTIFPFGLAT